MSQVRTAILLALLLLAGPLSFAVSAEAARSLTVALDATSFVAGEMQELRVSVTDRGAAVTTATVTLACAQLGCDALSALQPVPATIVGDGTAGRGANGEYVFTITPTQAGAYVANAALGKRAGSAGFDVITAAWSLQQATTPTDASIGETVAVTAVLYNDAPIARSVVGVLYEGATPLATYTGTAPAHGTVSLPMDYTPSAVGAIPLALGLEGTSDRFALGEIDAIPPATLAMDDVSASPLVGTTVPLMLHDANELTHAIVIVRYDPARVEIRGVGFGPDANLGTRIEVDEFNSTILVEAFAVDPELASGDLTLATIEFGSIGLDDTRSTLDLEVLEYTRVGHSQFARAEDAQFYGTLLGALAG